MTAHPSNVGSRFKGYTNPEDPNARSCAMSLLRGIQPGVEPTSSDAKG